jgi:hypothetical protein
MYDTRILNGERIMSELEQAEERLKRVTQRRRATTSLKRAVALNEEAKGIEKEIIILNRR